MTRLVQLRSGPIRRVARVDEPVLRLLDGVDSVLALAEMAMAANESLRALVNQRASSETADYDAVYAGASPWRCSCRSTIPSPRDVS